MGIKILELFVAFFKVGLFSFGGGYTLIPLIEQQVVEVNKWIAHDEFVKVLGVSQAIPGAISIKFATYVGYKVAGIPGVITTIIGSFIVPIIAVLILYNLLNNVENFPLAEKSLKAIKSATWGLIIGFGIEVFLKTNMEAKNYLIGFFALIGLTFFNSSPAIIIVIAGIAGVFLYQ